MSQQMTNQAIDKIRDELAANANDAGIGQIGEYVTERLQNVSSLASAVLAEEKTLTGAFGAMRDYAEEHRKDQCYFMPPKEAYGIVDRYYGFATDENSQEGSMVDTDELDLDALLGL